MIVLHIGIDYGIYINTQMEYFLECGLLPKEAYIGTLKSAGTAVAFTRLMLVLGVASWVFFKIKCQEDMGLLLAFIFLWNMVGSIVMLPAMITVLSPRRTGRQLG